MADEKGSSLLYILAPIGVLVVLLIAGYFLYQTYFTGSQQQTPPPNQTQQQPENNGWPTFTDANHGFSFQYPPTLNSQFASFNNSPNAIINPANSSFISQDGCYTPQQSNGIIKSNFSANGMNFCETTMGDPGAGQLYTSYWYTILHNSNYITLQYVVHTPNTCGPYVGGPNEQACNDFMAQINTIVVKPIQDSVATLTFTQ